MCVPCSQLRGYRVFHSQETRSQSLLSQSIESGLCTGCAACVNLCPYYAHYKDRIIVLNHCDMTTGRCALYCPRTPLNIRQLQEKLFFPSEITTELGPFKDLYMTRCVDPELRKKAQHGGTVSALVRLALSEGVIDTAVLSSHDSTFLSHSIEVNNPSEVQSCAGSNFVVSPTVAQFTLASQKDTVNRIGVVATPCQALSLAKMRAMKSEQDTPGIEKLKLVIGLFCGWAFDWTRLRKLLAEKIVDKQVIKMDIPPSKHECMEFYTEKGMAKVPIEDVKTCIRENCRYCYDMTCEFADISVGSARSNRGWGVDKGWNQVIVRSDSGRLLMDLARTKGVLEFKEVPEGNYEKMKKASQNKKRNCLANLREKSGDPQNLLYLEASDPAVAEVEKE